MDNKINFLKPFNAFIPNKLQAEKTIAPLYDTVTSKEARILAENNPKSFLHVTKAEIDFERNIAYNNPQVYKHAKENINKLIADNIFIKLDKPAFYIYKISVFNHVQLGLVCLCDTEAITNNFIKQHEHTRKPKEDDRFKNILAVNGSISSVMLTHKENKNISDLLLILTNRKPDISAKDHSLIEHEIFIIDDIKDIELINNNYLNLDSLYVADGHHRTQAAARVTKELHTNSSAKYFMVTVFPQEQVKILGYHRIIKELNGYIPEELIHLLSNHFDISASQNAVLPDSIHEFGMYIKKRWYKLKLKSESISKLKNSENNILDRLDCKILNDIVLGPLLGIDDIRSDDRVDFVGGSKSYREIEKYIDKLNTGVAFTLAPTRIQDLFLVSDQGLLMPPKSTWFYPKMCDGLLFYMFNNE